MGLNNRLNALENLRIKPLVTRRSKSLLATGILALVAALATFIYLLWPRYPDPIYNGVALSEHLYRLYSRPNSIRFSSAPTAREIAEWQRISREREVSLKALQKIGPEALPLLTNWLVTAPSTWRSNLHVRLTRSGYHFPKLTADRRSAAISCLAFYPTNLEDNLAPIIIPMLTNLHPGVLHSAARIIYRTAHHANDAQADAALRTLLPMSYRMGTVEVTSAVSFHSHAKFVIDQAIERLEPNRKHHPLVVLELGPMPNRVGAARELAGNPRLADRAIPLLVANLTSTNRSVQEHCAIALSAYGENAIPALPALSNLLTSSRPRVRIAASNAIVAIKAAKSVN